MLDRVRTDGQLRNGLCGAVAGMATPSVWYAFGHAVLHGMSRDNRCCVYLYHYLGMDQVESVELTAIRQAWAAHIARSIYEQIGA